MAETPEDIAKTLYTNLSPEERERALYNLNQYFEVVLGIFLRREQQAEYRVERFRKILTSCPQAPTLKDKGRILPKKTN